MKRKWNHDEIVRDWSLGSTEREWANQRTPANRLGFALLLKGFELEGGFPRGPHEIPSEAVEHIAAQLGVNPRDWASFDWKGRSSERQRARIRELLGFREPSGRDCQNLRAWLVTEAIDHERSETRLQDAVRARCREARIERPSTRQLSLVVTTALAKFDDGFATTTLERLSDAVRERLDALLTTEGRPGDRAVLHTLREDPGNVSLKNIQKALARLAIIDELELPPGLFDDASSRTLQAFHDRSEVEEPYELRRHPEELRYTLLAAYCHVRGRQLTDALVDLFIATVHRVGFRAERRV